MAVAEDEPAREGVHRDTERDPFFDAERDMSVRVGKRFEILGRLGGGGMGEVYKARDRELDEVVALKVLSAELDGDPQQLERLRREVKLARRISSPRVCRIHDIVELADGSRGVTMQLLHGRTLLRMIRDGAGQDWSRTVQWAADIAEGLGAAHALGIVHRDLKPENVMIDGEGRAAILDFGVAYQKEKSADDRLTAAGVILGTLLYMAPEQLAAAPLDGRADLYALGLVIAESITGTVPFAGRRYEEMLKNRVISPQPYVLRAQAPHVPLGLDRIVNDLLASDRELRPSSAFYVMSELRALVSGDEPSAVVPPGPAITVPVAAPERAATSTSRARLGPVIGILSALAGALIGGVVLLREPGQSPATTSARTMISPPSRAGASTLGAETSAGSSTTSAPAASPAPSTMTAPHVAASRTPAAAVPRATPSPRRARAGAYPDAEAH